VLVRKKSNPKDLVAEWDRKHKGEISKVEFRQGVRGLGLKADNKDIDILFDTIDTDGGGSLDLPELKDALKEMQEKEAEAMMEEARVASVRERLKQKLAMLEQTLTATAEAEEALEANSAQAALPLKRVALKLQAKLVAAEAEWEAKEKKEVETREREAQEKAEAHERELAKAAEKARLKAEKEAKEKAERATRLQEKDAKSASISLTSAAKELTKAEETPEEAEQRLLKQSSSKFVAMLTKPKPKGGELELANGDPDDDHSA